jgi:hypothetical protein
MNKFTYPLQAEGGQLLTAKTYEATVLQLILSALQTYKSERIWRNKYGINNRTFDPSRQIQPIISDAAEAIRYALGDRYAEVFVQVSGTFTDDGTLTLSVGYSLPSGTSGEVTL